MGRTDRSARRPGRLVVVGVLTALGVAGAGLVASGALSTAPAGTPPVGSPAATPVRPTPTPTPTPPPDAVLTLVAAGDVLPHLPVLSSARSGGGWDFAPLLRPVEPWVAGADLALCHLEVPVVPDGVRPSGYPVFGAPPALARGLAANGWDGCSTASNHSVDRGRAGVVATLDALDAAGLGHVGTARSAAEAAAPQVYEIERDGQTVRVAHVAATYGTNGPPVPADAPWSVTLLDVGAVVEQARRARADGADVVVASVHCCVEYVAEPTERQHAVARALARSGQVDLVIGHHAHVPQPVELLPGGPRGDGMWVAHGLGNFLSNQDGDCCTPRTESGLLLTATFRKPVDGPARLEAVEWTGVTVDRAGGHRVHALPDLLREGTAVGGAAPATRQQRVESVVGDDAPERTTPPRPSGPPPVVVPRGQRSTTASD